MNDYVSALLNALTLEGEKHGWHLLLVSSPPREYTFDRPNSRLTLWGTVLYAWPTGRMVRMEFEALFWFYPDIPQLRDTLVTPKMKLYPANHFISSRARILERGPITRKENLTLELSKLLFG